MIIRSLKRGSEFLYQNAPQDNPEFTEVMDKFIRGSILQSMGLLQSVEHDSSDKCGVSPSGTVVGPYSLGEFLQWRMGATRYANQMMSVQRRRDC